MAVATTSTEKPSTLQMDELSPEQFDQAMLTGELPPRGAPADTGAKAPADTADSAPAKPVDQAASTDASAKAATEAADSGKGKRPGQKKNAKERADEVEQLNSEDERRLQAALARRKQLREQVAAAERESEAPSTRADAPREAAARTDAEPKAWKKYEALPGAPKRPKMDDFDGKGVDAYMDAVQEWAADMSYFIAKEVAGEAADRTFDTRTRAQRDAAQREADLDRQVDRAVENAEKEKARDPEILDRIPQRWKELNPSDALGDQRLSPAHFVKDQVMLNSDHPLQLSEWLCADDYAELKRVSRLSPPQIIRELAIQDASFRVGDDPDPDEAAGERQHRRVSKAPAPVKGLPGKKAAAGKDPLKAPDSYDGFDAWNLEVSRSERR